MKRRHIGRLRINIALAILAMPLILHAQITTPLFISAAEPILDHTGQVMPGNADMPDNERPLVQLLWAHNGIQPPNPDGTPHPDNPPVSGGLTRIGALVTHALDRPGLFAVALANPRPTSGHMFVRVYSAHSLEASHYYGDSQIMTIQGNEPLRAVVAPVNQPIDPNALQAIPLEVTADIRNKTYGDVDPELTWQITAGALADGDTVTGTLERDPGEQVGSYVIGQGTLTAGTNYTLTYNPATLTITPKTVSIAGLQVADKVFDGQTLTSVTTPGTLVGVLNDDDVALDVSGAMAEFDSSAAGKVKTVTISGLTLQGPDAANYSVDDGLTTTATIFPWLHELADYRQVGEVWSPDAVNAMEGHAMSAYGNYVVTLASLLHFEWVTDDEGLNEIDPRILNQEMTGTDSYLHDGWVLNQAAAAEAKEVGLTYESAGDLEARIEDMLYQGSPVIAQLLHQPNHSKAQFKQVTALGLNLDNEIMVIDPTLPPTMGPIRLSDALDALGTPARVDRILSTTSEPSFLLQGFAMNSVELVLADSEFRVTGFDSTHPEDADGFLGKLQDIPQSGYHVEGVASGAEADGIRSFHVMNPGEGFYSLWVLGMSEGPYHLSLRATDGVGHTQGYTYDGIIEAGGVQEFLLHYAPERVEEPLRVIRPIDLAVRPPLQSDAVNEIRGNRVIPVMVQALVGTEPVSGLAPEIRMARGDYLQGDELEYVDMPPLTMIPTGGNGLYRHIMNTGFMERDVPYTLIVRVRDTNGIVIGETRTVLLKL